MKKLFLSGFIAFLLLITPRNVSALDSNPQSFLAPATKEGVLERLEMQKELREQMREEIKEQIQERKATIEARLAESRKNRVRFFFARLFRRLKAAVARLERLIKRIESRLAKIEEINEDIDTSPIKDQLEEAKGLLEEAEMLLLGAEDNLEEVLSAEDPKQAFEVIRSTIHEAKDLLIDAHGILVKVIGDIKGLKVELQD